MNLTDDIVFLASGSKLTTLVSQALDDTCRVLHNWVYPCSDYRFYNVSNITSNPRNPDLRLSFLKFFLRKANSFDEEWVKGVFLITHNQTDKHIQDNGITILKDLGVTCTLQPKLVAYHALRGLHIFLIALWARKGIQLPISFSLPQTTVYPNNGWEGNYRLDTAYEIYPPLLKLVRKPFQIGVADSVTPDLTNYIPTSSLSNFKSLAWRPILASSWRNVEDITLDELSGLFESLITRRQNGTTSYALSAKAWIGPLFDLDASKFTFTMADVRQLNKSSFPSRVVYDAKYHTPEHSNQRDSWNTWVGNYLQMLSDTGRVKNTSPQSNSLADLSSYFLSTLPSFGVTAPSVENVTRLHVDGFEKAPPLRTLFKNRTASSHASSFFDYVSTTLASQGESFPNPLTKYDKPFEPRPALTNKKTFAFNEFREFYALSYAILGFIEHILYRTLKGEAPPEWQQTLLGYTHINAIVDTEMFGYTPVINYMDIQGVRHSIPMRFIPFKLLCLEQLPIRTNDGQIYLILPTPDCIACIIIAIETSIRFIHIRWLDRLRATHDTPHLADDYLAALNEEVSNYFNLFINTDKSGTPWIRATSTRLLKVFHTVASYKKRIARNHFDQQMKYTHHDLTHYPWITALFCNNKDATVLREYLYRAYYKHQIYYFHQLRLANEQPPLEALPIAVQQLASLSDYQTAYDHKPLFKTSYTPHGIRATVISLSSTFLSDEHIGQNISGHETQSVTRYVVINKQLVSDVSVLTGSKIVSALSWSKADMCAAPKTSHELLHETFAIQAPNGQMLSNEDILKRRHMLTTFSTHFCLANGECTDDVVRTIGKYSCGQCYLGLKSKGHLPAIISYTRRLSCDMDELRVRMKAVNGSIADGVLRGMEEQFRFLVNEFSAWTLTAQHMIKNAEILSENFLVVADEKLHIHLAKLPKDNFIDSILIRISDAISYPELANSSLKADIFRLSAKLMTLDSSFSSLFSIDNDQTMLHEMKGRLESMMIANNFSVARLATLIQEAPSNIPPKVAAL